MDRVGILNENSRHSDSCIELLLCSRPARGSGQCGRCFLRRSRGLGRSGRGACDEGVDFSRLCSVGKRAGAS